MSENAGNGQSLEDQWGAALSEAQQAAPPPPQPPRPAPEAKPANFGTLREENTGTIGNLEMILDIPVTIAVEIGRTRMVVKDLLALSQGAIIELEKLAGEPMEILVHGKLIARGEAVVVNEKFGVKLTDVISPSERISRLK